MKTLADWLREQIHARGMTQKALAAYAGVSAPTLTEILRYGHVPRLELLFRLADYFDTPREYVLRLAARMEIEDSQPVGETEYLRHELLEEFRKVPDEWKEEAIRQVELVARLTNRPAVRLVGEEDGEERGERREERDGEETAAD
jgi:transcriptional regulator with XRE-family HTH domain